MKTKEIIASILQATQALKDAVTNLETENAALKAQLGETTVAKPAKAKKAKVAKAQDVKTGEMKTVRPGTKMELKTELPKTEKPKGSVLKTPAGPVVNTAPKNITGVTPPGPIKPVEPAKIINSETGAAAVMK